MRLVPKSKSGFFASLPVFERQNSKLSYIKKKIQHSQSYSISKDLLTSSLALGPLNPVDEKGKERRQSHKGRGPICMCQAPRTSEQREASVRVFPMLSNCGRSLAAVGEGAGIRSSVLLAAASPTSGVKQVIESDFFRERVG